MTTLLTLCVTTLNRSVLFARSLDSLARCGISDLEIVVTDWESSDADVEDLVASSIRPDMTYKFKTLRDPGEFSRGLGLNMAADMASSDMLLFVDTDMLIPTCVLTSALKYLYKGEAYFPVCRSYTDPKHNRWRWRRNGKGIAAVTRKTFMEAGRWDEFRQWGGEDAMFFARVSEVARIHRPDEPDLWHMWHTPTNSRTRRKR